MLGHYGWIKALQRIDHPDAGKHGGRIYVHRKDFRSRSDPQSGDEVVFCVYADESGLGAEDCYVVGEAQPLDEDSQHCQWINSKPYEADDDMSSDDDDDGDFSCSMNPRAHEFVPSYFPSMSPTALEFMPQMPQPAFEYTPQMPQMQTGGTAFNMSYFDDDSDSESESEFDPVNRSKLANGSDDRSTQAGDSSDSEADMQVLKFPMVMPPGLPGLMPPGLEPPPGLELPPGLEFLQPMPPPPGLELTPEEMLVNRLLVVA